MSRSMNHKIDPAKLWQLTPSDALPFSFFGDRAYPRGMLPLAPGLMPYCIPYCFVWAESPFCVLNPTLALWDPHSSCFSFSRPTQSGLPRFDVLYMRLSNKLCVSCLLPLIIQSFILVMDSVVIYHFASLMTPFVPFTLEETADEWT